MVQDRNVIRISTIKWNCLVIFAVLVLVFSGCAQQVVGPEDDEEISETESQIDTETRDWSEDESQRIAKDYIRSCPTFEGRDGREETLRLIGTTTLEQPFSWQFTYEFQCGFPGYGPLGSEPTPQVITPHIARVVVQEGEVTYAVLDDERDILAAMPGGIGSHEKPATIPSAELPEGNLVRVHFIDECGYKVSGDTFINEAVIVERWWRTNLINDRDETQAPVTGLRLTLDSEESFHGIERENLTKTGPPIYEWFLGDVGNNDTVNTDGWPWDAFIVKTNYPVKLAPGYDTSCSFDKTEFSAPGTQTLTITVIPREEKIETLDIYVHADEDNFVDPVIVSYSSSSGGDVNIAQGGHRSGIHFVPVELDTPLTITVIIQVTPKASRINYRPYITVNPHRPGEPSSGTSTGSSVSFTTEVGTWTWSADGDYVWNWSGSGAPGVSITFPAHSSSASS